MSKVFAREIVEGLVPEEILIIKIKTGFNAPREIWFRNELKPLIMKSRKHIEKLNIYNLEKVDKMIKEHMPSEKNHMMFSIFISL